MLFLFTVLRQLRREAAADRRDHPGTENLLRPEHHQERRKFGTKLINIVSPFSKRRRGLKKFVVWAILTSQGPQSEPFCWRWFQLIDFIKMHFAAFIKLLALWAWLIFRTIVLSYPNSYSSLSLAGQLSSSSRHSINIIEVIKQMKLKLAACWCFFVKIETRTFLQISFSGTEPRTFFLAGPDSKTPPTRRHRNQLLGASEGLERQDRAQDWCKLDQSNFFKRFK